MTGIALAERSLSFLTSNLTLDHDRGTRAQFPLFLSKLGTRLAEPLPKEGDEDQRHKKNRDKVSVPIEFDVFIAPRCHLFHRIIISAPWDRVRGYSYFIRQLRRTGSQLLAPLRPTGATKGPPQSWSGADRHTRANIAYRLRERVPTRQ